MSVCTRTKLYHPVRATCGAILLLGAYIGLLLSVLDADWCLQSDLDLFPDPSLQVRQSFYWRQLEQLSSIFKLSPPEFTDLQSMPPPSPPPPSALCDLYDASMCVAPPL